MELNGKIINFLGDSITAGAGASGIDARYTTLVAKQAKLADFHNYGIGGTRIARQQNRTNGNPVYDNNDFCGRYDKMEDADIIVVFGGSNDYGHGDAPFGSFEDRTPDTFNGAVHYLFSGLLSKYPDKTIVAITPMHRENENKLNMHGKILKDYVDVIRNVCSFYSIPLLDLYANAGICPDIPAQKAAFTVDGLHPNDAGNKIIASRLYHFLLNL